MACAVFSTGAAQASMMGSRDDAEMEPSSEHKVQEGVCRSEDHVPTAQVTCVIRARSRDSPAAWTGFAVLCAASVRATVGVISEDLVALVACGRGHLTRRGASMMYKRTSRPGG